MNCKWKHRSSCCNCGLLGLFFTCEQNNCTKAREKNIDKIEKTTTKTRDDESKSVLKHNSGSLNEGKGKFEAGLEQDTGGISRQYYETYLNRAMYSK